MRARTVQTWIARHIVVRLRLEHVCTSYLLFLMVATRKHSLEEAARFSGLHKSQFSKMLKAHSKVAAYTLDRLSKQQAKRLAKARQKLQSCPGILRLSWIVRSNIVPVCIQKIPRPSITDKDLSWGISGPMSSCSSMTC